MTKYQVSKLVHLHLYLFFFISCNGQIKSPIQTGTPVDLQASLPKQSTLAKTQGSGPYQNVFCGIQDKNGNLWFGTTGEGVYKYDGKLFTQFTMKDGLSSNEVWSILEDKNGNIWFGTTDGICRTDGNKINSVSIGFGTRPITNGNYYTKWSTANTVWSMLQDKTGKIWFGTGDGVYRYDGKNFSRFLSGDNVINNDNLQLKLVSGMLEDKNGNIWFASGMPPGNEGLCRYDGKAVKSFKPKGEGWIRNVVESKNGNLLLATRHFGVWSYNAQLNEGFGPGKSFNNYSQPNELVNGSLSTILEDKVGNLWVASDYGKDLGDTLGGLWYSTNSVVDTTQKTFTKISNSSVHFIMEDKDNNIWFGTRGMGLYRFDRKSITKFSE